MSKMDLAKRLRIKAGVVSMGEKIAWGSDTELMLEAADIIEQQAAEIAALRGFAEDYLCEIKNDTSYRNNVKEHAHQMYIARLEALLAGKPTVLLTGNTDSEN